MYCCTSCEPDFETMDDALVDEFVAVAKAIGRSDIPREELLQLHVDQDFVHLTLNQLGGEVYERLQALARQRCCSMIGETFLLELQSGEAFDLLTALCRRYPEVRGDEQDLRGYLYLLHHLADYSNTTELPEGMTTILDENPEMAGDLRRLYRLSG